MIILSTIRRWIAGKPKPWIWPKDSKAGDLIEIPNDCPLPIIGMRFLESMMKFKPTEQYEQMRAMQNASPMAWDNRFGNMAQFQQTPHEWPRFHHIATCGHICEQWLLECRSCSNRRRESIYDYAAIKKMGEEL